MKKCKKCEIEKDEQDFNKWYKKSGCNGFRSYCKSCESLINKDYRDKKRDELKEKRRRRTGSTPRQLCTDPLKKIRNEQMYRSVKKYPEKTAARQFLSSYIRMGKMIKPSICERCLEEKKVEGHHEDYTKPLDVKWLCKRCHTDIHWNS